MTKFDQLHSRWLEMHVSQRQGERKRRLQSGHAHAEVEALKKIWLPAFGHFKYLHPEYEVKDFLEGRRFLDFAYIRPPFRIAVEIDGYGTHYRDISRRDFCNERMRQMHLTNDGWIVIRIGYDDINERPKVWQQLLLHMIGRLFGDFESNTSQLYSQEQEVVRLAVRLERQIKLKEVCDYLQCGYRKARSLLNRLEEQRILMPVAGGRFRTHAWKVDETHPYLLAILGN